MTPTQDRARLTVATVLAVATAALLDAMTPLTTGDWLLLMTAPAPALFVLRYARVRWSSTVSGRAIMLKSTGTALFLGLACATVVLGEFPGRDLLRVAIYGFLFAAQWYLTTLLFRLQRQARTPSTDTLTEV